MISNRTGKLHCLKLFAYNNMVNRSIDKTHFKIIYTCSPRNVCDLVVMPTINVVGDSKATANMAKKALKIHAEVRAHLKVVNAKYKAEADKHHCKKVFVRGDVVMAYLWQSCFPDICTKLEKEKHGPLRAKRKINNNAYDNAYVLQLRDNWNISHIFNVADLFEYRLDDEDLYEPNSRISSFPSKGD